MGRVSDDSSCAGILAWAIGFRTAQYLLNREKPISKDRLSGYPSYGLLASATFGCLDLDSILASTAGLEPAHLRALEYRKLCIAGRCSYSSENGAVMILPRSKTLQRNITLPSSNRTTVGAPLP